MPAGLASGIIEYLAEGAWTKRIHPGWAAQAGLQRHARCAGILRARTVFEGIHGLSMVSRASPWNFAELTEGFGETWVIGEDYS